MMKDYSTPRGVYDTANAKEAAALSDKFKHLVKNNNNQRKTIAVIGGGLSGLACAKYLADAGHEPTVYEARDVLGGKVSSWKDEDGDIIETGLHIFFGAYPNTMNLFRELNIEKRLQWKKHTMIFAMQELPGEFTSFDFIPGIPAPLNFGLAVLMNQKMLTMSEKISILPALIPMLVEGQSFIDAADEFSVLEFMEKYGMPSRVNDEVFIAMAKSLDFADPNILSMSPVLTAMNRFMNEADGSQCAFLDGGQSERLCGPLQYHIESKGGKVLTSSPIKKICTREDGSVSHLTLRNGEEIVADEYISAMPVDVLKRFVPKAWSQLPYFEQLKELEGIPVINIQLWFDSKLNSVNHLCFSRSKHLSVYADMSTTCKEYQDENKSMLELVFAPCSIASGADVNWLGKSDDEIVAVTLEELERLFPVEVARDGSKAKLLKSSVVRVPFSVYAALPGKNRFRPSQTTPIPNFTLAGDFTEQKYLGSMEGAVLAGKLAADVVCSRAAGINSWDGPMLGVRQDKPVQPFIVDRVKTIQAKGPIGVKGEGAIAYGGGAATAVP
jgi:15-cis-phytoene desaturase